MRLEDIALFGLFATVLGGVRPASAIDFRARFDLQTNGIYRSLSQQGFSEAATVADGLVFFGSQVMATSDSFEFEVRHELRSIFGDTPTYPPGDIARLNIQSPERFFRMDRILIENDRTVVVSDFERMRASWVLENGEIWLGRRPISLGTLSFFRVWNKFTRPIAGLFGPVITFGSDGFGASYQFGDVSFKAVSLYGVEKQDDAHLVEMLWYNPFAEIRFLGGRWWNHTAAGFAFSKTIFDWMLRFESVHLKNDSRTETQVGLGIDGAISSVVSVLAETYYQSIGEVDTSRYTVFDPSRFTNMRARYYSILLLNWQATSLWKLAAGDLINGVDGGMIGILRANYSWSDNIELVSEFNLPFASEGAEFAKRTFVFKDGNYLGSGSQLTVGLKATF